MGLFDSIYAGLTCPYCGYKGEMEIQVKIDPGLSSYKIGDEVKWDRIIDITFEDDAYCPRCREKERNAEEQVDKKLRKKFKVPEEVCHEAWFAWPGGTPILERTKTHRAYKEGVIPTYEKWCKEQGFDPKAKREKGSDPWMEYLSGVLRPYLVKIKAPDGYLMYDDRFRDIAWRNLMTEELDALRASGKISQAYHFPVVIKVKNRIITSVRLKT